MKIRTDQTIFADREKITRRIARFWNQISESWRLIWGAHIHHGYYEDQTSANQHEAQIKLIEKLADLAELQPQSNILDVGCGMGGSSFYLAERYAATVTGITLSQKQVTMATAQAREKNLKNPVFQVEDALTLSSFAADSFDLLWSLESCEQFFDKQIFLQQAYRVLKPGGKLMLATWCSSQDEYEGRQAKKYKKLCQAFDLPYMPSIEHYATILTQTGFKLTKKSNWSSAVQQSWELGISLVKAYSFLKLLALSGWRGLRFARQLRLMHEGFQTKTVHYGVFIAEKPSLLAIGVCYATAAAK